MWLISFNSVSTEAGEFWAHACDLFRGTLSRGGRGRRAGVVLEVCCESSGFLLYCFLSQLGRVLHVGKITSSCRGACRLPLFN